MQSIHCFFVPNIKNAVIGDKLLGLYVCIMLLITGFPATRFIGPTVFSTICFLCCFLDVNLL